MFEVSCGLVGVSFLAVLISLVVVRVVCTEETAPTKAALLWRLGAEKGRAQQTKRRAILWSGGLLLCACVAIWYYRNKSIQLAAALASRQRWWDLLPTLGSALNPFGKGMQFYLVAALVSCIASFCYLAIRHCFFKRSPHPPGR